MVSAANAVQHCKFTIIPQSVYLSKNGEALMSDPRTRWARINNSWVPEGIFSSKAIPEPWCKSGKGRVYCSVPEACPERKMSVEAKHFFSPFHGEVRFRHGIPH